MLEEEANEIPKQSPEVVGELGQEIVKVAKGDIATTKDGATAAAEDGVAVEGASPNLSPYL